MDYRYIEVPDNTTVSRLRAASWCQHYAEKVAEFAPILAAHPEWPARPAEGPIDFWRPDRFFPNGRWWWNTVEARGMRYIDVEDGVGSIVRMARAPKLGNMSKGERFANQDIQICSDPDIAKAMPLPNVRNDPRSFVRVTMTAGAAPLSVAMGHRFFDTLSGDVWESQTRGVLTVDNPTGRFVVRNTSSSAPLDTAILSMEGVGAGDVSIQQAAPVATQGAAHKARALLGMLELDVSGNVDLKKGNRLPRSQQFRITNGDIVTRASVRGKFDSALSLLEEQEDRDRQVRLALQQESEDV